MEVFLDELFGINYVFANIQKYEWGDCTVLMYHNAKGVDLVRQCSAPNLVMCFQISNMHCQGYCPELINCSRIWPKLRFMTFYWYVCCEDLGRQPDGWTRVDISKKASISHAWMYLGSSGDTISGVQYQKSQLKTMWMTIRHLTVEILHQSNSFFGKSLCTSQSLYKSSYGFTWCYYCSQVFPLKCCKNQYKALSKHSRRHRHWATSVVQ